MVKPGDISIEPQTDFDEAIANMEPSSDKIEMKELEDIVTNILSTLPKLNRIKLRLEMESMVVKLEENPTTADLNRGLSYAQGYKDRLAEIYNLALREYKVRNRCMEMLFDAVNYVSNGKSADKRRGEATMKYPMYIIHLEAAETFLKEVEHILQNMKSTHDSVSRQVSIMQIQLQLGEVRRDAPTNNVPRNNQAEEFSHNTKKGELDWNSF